MFAFLAFALSLTGALANSGEVRQIYLAGTFPIQGSDGWQGGQACLPAAQLALEDVNKSPDLLPGYHLNLAAKDDMCDSGRGAYALYELIYKDPKKVMILSGCSTVCTTLAEAASQWNLLTVCYGASSPALSNRDRFPTLFRTHPSATVHNPTRVTVFKKYNWIRISVIQEAEEVFATTMDDLEQLAKEENIEIFNRQIFKDDPKAAIQNLKRQDSRIIVGLFYAKTARKVLCEIYLQGMFGPKYVWFFIGWYEDDWFKRKSILKEEGIICTQAQMIQAAEGHFTTEALMWNQNREEVTASGRTVAEFNHALLDKLNEDIRYKNMMAKSIMPEGYLEAPLAYDAVWATALALNKTAELLEAEGMTLDDYTYDNKGIANIMQKSMQAVKFLGISGWVAFSEETGDRMAWTKIEQLINQKYEVVGYYDQSTNNLTWNLDEKGEELVVWSGGKPPQDRTIILPDLQSVSAGLYLPLLGVSLLGIVMALVLLAVNNKFNYRRIIMYSHPSCNNLILTGIMLCLLATIPLGMDIQMVSDAMFPVVCATPKWLLNLGFSLGYGAMFTKIWRVHRIATHTKAKGEDKIKYIGKKPLIQTPVVPWKLWSIVACLVGGDAVFLSLWQIIDPLHKQIHKFDTYESPNNEEDVKYEPQVWVCRSDYHNIWLGITYAYKGLLLILGLFLAYETRSVKVKQINDSRLVGMSIYNVSVLCIITAPVSLVIADKPNATFAFVALANVFCCYLSMALVFVPKVLFIMRHPGHDPREREDDDERKRLEQETKLKLILKENEDLQKSISDKDYKIGLLKKHLELRREEEEKLRLQHSKNGNCRLRSTDLSRQESLRGITVLRGPLPGSATNAESYL